MANPPTNNENLLKYYNQKKQRIDLDIDMNIEKVVGLTKLTFSLNEKLEKVKKPDYFILYLNAENIHINNIKIQRISKNEKDNIDNENIYDLSFKNSSPYLYYKNYLDQLYFNIEELESFKNINRIEWEIRQKGNLEIKIPKKYVSEENDGNSLMLSKKIKIIINYDLVEKNTGIIFQQFKADNSYKICYTPNFYYNTQNWVPCIYNLQLQINWSLYIYVPNNFMSYSSCRLNKIIEDSNGKKLIISKTIEPNTARNIGFIIANEKIFKRNYDQTNKNFVIIGNENKKERIEKNLINNKLIGTLYNYYYEFFDVNEDNLKSNLNSPTIIVFVPYLLVNYPFEGFKKFIKLKEENYFSFIKFPSLYILPEKYIYSENIPEISKFQMRMLSKLFITNYIGGLIIEKSYADFWIINGLENWISNLFLNKIYDKYYIKSKIYNWLLKFKHLSKKGKETLPLYTNNFTHPIEIQLNPIFNLKSKILFHLLESKVKKIHLQKCLRNIINERSKKGYNISTENLIEFVKKNCSLNIKNFIDLYVYKTGMFEINLDYIYDNKTNSIDFKIKQKQIAQNYYENHPFFKIKNINNDYLDKIGKYVQIIDFRTKLNKFFDVDFKLNIFQKKGFKIRKDIHLFKFLPENDNICYNFPITTKFRKNKLKRREKKFINNLIENTGINKIYTKDEIEDIFTKNSFLWVSSDSQMSSLHLNKINQQHIIYEYIKMFSEVDCIGQMESLYNIGKNKDNYEKSLEILKILIKYNNTAYYKVKQYAIKIYIKILLKLKKENEYQFLLDTLDDYYNQILKNKTKLNLDNYYVMKEIIKYLGEYEETNFKQSNTEGKISNSSIKNKIINKLLTLLINNELYTIINFDNCYIIADILLSCSNLYLQEKSIIVLENILKNLRIEKLKRGTNEITIISSLVAFINLLINNDFFFTKREKNNKIIIEIFKELSYFMNDDNENYELIVILEYLNIFFIFYKSQSYIELSNHLVKFVLGEYYNNNSKMGFFTIKKNLQMISKIKALKFIFDNYILYFDSLDEKIAFLSSLKIILYSPICYFRGDCRIILENLYDKFYHKEISEKGAGNHNFNNINFLHLLNKERINFTSKKYADKNWLLYFINENKIISESEKENIIKNQEEKNNNKELIDGKNIIIENNKGKNSKILNNNIGCLSKLIKEDKKQVGLIDKSESFSDEEYSDFQKQNKKIENNNRNKYFNEKKVLNKKRNNETNKKCPKKKKTNKNNSNLDISINIKEI